jgi:hypothetical protein
LALAVVVVLVVRIKLELLVPILFFHLSLLLAVVEVVDLVMVLVLVVVKRLQLAVLAVAVRQLRLVGLRGWGLMEPLGRAVKVAMEIHQVRLLLVLVEAGLRLLAQMVVALLGAVVAVVAMEPHHLLLVPL